MSWNESLLQSFVEQCYPDSQVRHRPFDGKYLVSIVVDPRDLAQRRAEYLRDLDNKLTPKFRPRRQLHWGPRCCRGRR